MPASRGWAASIIYIFSGSDGGPEETFLVICHDCAQLSSFVPAEGRMGAVKSVRAVG